MAINVDLIFLRPQCCKSRFLEDRTENCILELRKPVSEDWQGVLLGVANKRAKLDLRLTNYIVQPCANLMSSLLCYNAFSNCHCDQW